MANICQNKLTVIGQSNDFELFKLERDSQKSTSGTYHSEPVIWSHLEGFEDQSQAHEFETEWIPPEEFLKKVSRRLHNLVFCVSYYEPGAITWGRLLYWNGKAMYEERYEGINEVDIRKAKNFYRGHQVLVNRGVKWFQDHFPGRYISNIWF